ncbi:hypothetical protein C8J57DRAFT_1436351 [Mycena rebaudengoi]|nr:hypothetical protein C8J57DRAFT_1436351 [Mycena rebaudengoi]
MSDLDSPEDFNPGADHTGDEHVHPPLQPDDAQEIKRIFHPHSQRLPTFQSFHEYSTLDLTARHGAVDKEPWRPFRTRLDFEVAEFCELAMLNRDLTETLISLIRRCGQNIKKFTINNQAELNELWDLASHKCTEFVRDEITVPYKSEEKTYNTYTRPLWDWVLSLVQDPRLASSFVWDAEKVYRFDEDAFVRFYHEPWTADAFWEAQSKLPNNPAAKPVCIAVYADKSKLSTFGTEKGYAVIATVLNLPISIRHGVQIGSGQVVGHQPIVKEDTKENNKPAFANFKNVVWHSAFFKLLESLVDPAKVGHWTQCGDKIPRWLWPIILILASDYEEACVMALIRGLQCLYPCPICFVPWNEQSDLATTHQVRTGLESKQILEEARDCETAGEREKLLKDNGLRDAENVFWKINNTDPHQALSFDRLHAYHGGLWSDHIWAQIKLRVTALGRGARAKIDNQISAIPRWRGLNHFDAVMNISFNDGSKHQDIAKMMLFVAHNVLVDKPGVLLLQALRSYLELDMYVGLQVHTSRTIAAGRRELLPCEEDVEEKSWNFPKMHSHQHVFDDIESKGASRNFGTKINESKHGAMRQTYHRLTNFKDVTPQLIKHDHRRIVALYVREQLDELDGPENIEEPEDLEPITLSNVSVGSKLKPLTFAMLGEEMAEDVAFHRFRIRFADALSDFLPAYGYNLPDGKRISLDKIDKIVPFQYLKVYYESLGSWASTADHLRCNPKFHGHPRYDAALVKTTDAPIFVRLLYMFSYTLDDATHHFALVLPLDARGGARSKKDKSLRFHRVYAQPRTKTEIFPVRSIIRGAVLVPDFDKDGEFIVFDVVDDDTSLRLKSTYPGD